MNDEQMKAAWREFEFELTKVVQKIEPIGRWSLLTREAYSEVRAAIEWDVDDRNPLTLLDFEEVVVNGPSAFL